MWSRGAAGWSGVLVGLHRLNPLNDVSDERVVASFIENPYGITSVGKSLCVSCLAIRRVWWSGGSESDRRDGAGGLDLRPLCGAHDYFLLTVQPLCHDALTSTVVAQLVGLDNGTRLFGILNRGQVS